MDVIVIPEIIIAICGLIACFAGYKFFRLTMTLAGMAAGYVLGDYLYLHFGETFGIAGSEVWATWVPVAFALILGCVTFALYIVALKVSVTLVTGILITDTYLKIAGDAEAVGVIIALAVGLFVGFLLSLLVEKFQRGAIILVSAALGARVSSFILARRLIKNDVASDVLNSLKGFVFAGGKLSTISFAAGVLLIVFFILGIIVQSSTTK